MKKKGGKKKKKLKDPKVEQVVEFDKDMEILSEGVIDPDASEDSPKHYHKKHEVPLWERSLLTIKEASDYTGLGVYKLRILAAKPNTGLILHVGAKKMLKRKKLDEYLEKAFSI